MPGSTDVSEKHTAANPDADQQGHPKMGSGSCKLCSCPSFSPSTTGRQCINLNAEGGTCNHWDNEHN